MNIEIKKKFAREFLILMAILISSLVVYLCIYPINSIRQSEIEKTEKILLCNKIKMDSLNNQRDNVQDLLSLLDSQSDFSKAFTYQSLIQTLSNDLQSKELFILIESDSNLKGVFLDYSDFKNMFRKELSERQTAKDISSRKAFLNEQNNRLTLQKNTLTKQIFTASEQLNFTTIFFIILLFIFYPLRGVYFATLWSIRTLKKKT